MTLATLATAFGQSHKLLTNVTEPVGKMRLLN